VDKYNQQWVFENANLYRRELAPNTYAAYKTQIIAYHDRQLEKLKEQLKTASFMDMVDILIKKHGGNIIVEIAERYFFGIGGAPGRN
jgi:DNA-binding MurR/RpiR family transcriptional regulator